VAAERVPVKSFNFEPNGQVILIEGWLGA